MKQMSVSRFPGFAAAACALTFMASAPAAAENVTERVKFASGATSATIKGVVTGYDTHSYVLGAGAGQAMSVLFNANNNACYFNLIEPGADSAIHMGDVAGNEFSGTLKKSGDYRIEAYLMRSEARRGKTCKFSFTVEISGSGQSSTAEDALVPGTDFNATGEINCAREAGQPLVRCNFGVKRDGNGGGTVTVFWPEGGNRVIYLEGSRPVRYDQSEADGEAEMTVQQNADLFIVSVGDQRFEIPEVVIVGD
jgi:hypothetical protein